MTENQIATAVIAASLELHRSFGSGMLESAYRAALVQDLQGSGFAVAEEVPVSMVWKGKLVPIAFRADCIVDGKVLVELKSIERLALVHKKQLLTYLRLTGLKLGLLINFGGDYLKDGIERVVNGLGRG